MCQVNIEWLVFLFVCFLQLLILGPKARAGVGHSSTPLHAFSIVITLQPFVCFLLVSKSFRISLEALSFEYAGCRDVLLW